MSAITFTATIKNGIIEVPDKYKEEINQVDQVKITLVTKQRTAKIGIIAELIKNPIVVENFQPLTREAANDRNF